MVRPSFIKSLNEEKMTFKDWVIELLWYNSPMIFLRRLGRFLRRLPDYLHLCWTDESWDFEGLYDYIEMFLKHRKRALEQDTWHTEDCVKRALRQIELTSYHLERYRNWPKYYEWPEPEHVKLPNGCYQIVYKDEDRPKCDYVHKMESKHYEHFWRLLKKYHSNWWT